MGAEPLRPSRECVPLGPTAPTGSTGGPLRTENDSDPTSSVPFEPLTSLGKIMFLRVSS